MERFEGDMPKTSGKDISQTEIMLNDVLELIKSIESRLEIVLSDVEPRAEEIPNIQNKVQAKLHMAIENLQTLRNRINL